MELTNLADNPKYQQARATSQTHRRLQCDLVLPRNHLPFALAWAFLSSRKGSAFPFASAFAFAFAFAFASHSERSEEPRILLLLFPFVMAFAFVVAFCPCRYRCGRN
jgi:hypothetical protein